MEKGQYVGIDFGTTNTAVVLLFDDEFGRRTIHLGEGGDYPFSSIVAIPKNGEELLFGREVRERRYSLTETHEIVTSMKSFLGKEIDGIPYSFSVGNKKYYPKDITRSFLSYVKEYVRQQTGLDINEASFAYPMDFSPQARRELMQAATEAGIEVKAFMSESTAAYIANSNESKAFSRVMVLDWGGGTFDISILRLDGNNVQEIAVWGDDFGGDDIDYEFAERMHARIVVNTDIAGRRFKDMSPSERDHMIHKCEQAKILISESNDWEDYSLDVYYYGIYGNQHINISEEQFNAIVEPLIKKRVLKAIDAALDNAGGFTPDSIDAVIVVGGSSNLRSYEYAILNKFKHAKVVLPDEAQWATAIGAALMQIVGGEIKLSESVGVLLSDDTVFPVLPEGHVVGKSINPITFSLTTDELNAHFIFTDSTKNTVYSKNMIPTKGFLKEKLLLNAEITKDQIASIKISNGNFENECSTIEINKLKFHYDLSNLSDIY